MKCFQIACSLIPIVAQAYASSASPQSILDHQDLTAEATQKDVSKWDWKLGFWGIVTFANLPNVNCLLHPTERFDIAIIGAPFDTAVSFRTGARFGPRYIRAASTRLNPRRAFNARAHINPFDEWAKVIDCEDIPVTPYENFVALRQLSEAYAQLGSNPVSLGSPISIPKLITLGGDHSITLPALRALHAKYNKQIAIVHFDAHLDTWVAGAQPPWTHEANGFNHGSMLWQAHEEGLILNGSIHVGLRSRIGSAQDWVDDDKQGWERIFSDDIDDIGAQGIIDSILKQIGTEHPTYLSIDIDVLDPTAAPGTGTPEVGGWTTRELIRILRGIEELNLVGADVVEVSPAYDDQAETTTKAAQQFVFEIVTSIVTREIHRKKHPN